MTVKELYDWALENNAENLNIEIQYRDGGGFYSGTDWNIKPEIDKSDNFENETVVVL